MLAANFLCLAFVLNPPCLRLQDGPVSTTSADKRIDESKSLNQELLKAAERGASAETKKLLRLGANPNYREQTLGWSAIMFAGARGHRSVIQILMRSGARLEDRDSLGNTPLMSAARLGREKAVAVLLDLGAKVNAKDKSGDTPLLLAASGPWPNVVGKLLARGANVNAQNKSGETALFWSARRRPGGNALAIKFAKQALQTVTILLKAGARVNTADHRGRTALMVTSMKGNDAIAKALLVAGARVDLRDNAGKSAIDFARQGRHSQLVQLLSSFRHENMR